MNLTSLQFNSINRNSLGPTENKNRLNENNHVFEWISIELQGERQKKIEKKVEKVKRKRRNENNANCHFFGRIYSEMTQYSRHINNTLA